MKPLWLLDVDGVLNAIEPKPKHEKAWEGYEYIRARGGDRTWMIRYAPKLVQQIKELMELDLVEVQWLTTWMEDANVLAEPFGWPQLPCAATRDEFLSDGLSWWKLGTAKRVSGNRALIWTDDDLMNEEAARWVTERPWRTLAICPSYRGGLQPKEFDAIADFCVSVCSEDAEVS